MIPAEHVNNTIINGGCGVEWSSSTTATISHASLKSSQLCAVYGMLRTYLNTVHLSPASTDSECLHDSRFCTMAHRCWRILTGMALHLQLVPVLPVALPPLATWCKSFSEAASSSNALKFFTNNAVKYSSPCFCL